MAKSTASKYENPQAKGSVRLAITQVMSKAYELSGTVEFVSLEIFELVKETFPTLNVNRVSIQNAMNSMKTAGLIVKVGERPEPVGPPKYLWALTDILEKSTKPVSAETLPAEDIPVPNPIGSDFPASEMLDEVIREPIDPVYRAGRFVQRNHLTANPTPKETEMATSNSTPESSDRKPRQGTPEHDIMQLKKLTDRKDEQIDALITAAEKLTKEFENNSKDFEKKMQQCVEMGNESLAAILEAMKQVRSGVMGTVEVIAAEVAEIHKRNASINEKLEKTFQVLAEIDQIEKKAYGHGFSAGWRECLKGVAEELKDSFAERVKKNSPEPQEELPKELAALIKAFPEIKVIPLS